MEKIQHNRFSKVLVLFMAVIMVLTMMPNGRGWAAETAWAAEEEARTSVSTEFVEEGIEVVLSDIDEGEDISDGGVRQTQVAAYVAETALQGSGTETDPYLIGSTEEFAAMPATGYCRLTRNIEVTQPYKSTFKGNFDGDGYAVTLKLNVTSGNAGLFAETGSGAVIQNVIVDAQVVSSDASSSYATGGLIGKVNGKTDISNCGVYGTVKNTSSSTGYPSVTGGIVGYISGNCTISESFSTCDVENGNQYSSACTGGLIGKTSNYYTLDVNNCYASGNVTAKKGYAGGITGYVQCSANYKHTYNNCYAAGNVGVSGAASNACGFAYSYASAGFYFINCFYNNTNSKGLNKSAEGLTGKTADELKSLAHDLGNAFQPDTSNINNGYPILAWQYIDPNATCEVTFQITPNNSVLTWNGAEQAVSEDGSYTFHNVGVGEYAYSVTNEAGDYTAQSGTISAKGKDISQNINLQLNKHSLTFVTVPETLNLEVTDGVETLIPKSGKSYSVVNGTYAYTASAFGYKTRKEDVTVDRGDKTENVNLEAQPIVTVTFAYAEHAESVSGSKIEVTTEGRIMPAKDGSDGMVYELPAGYSYTYKFTSGNYARQTGPLDLLQVTEKQNRSVMLPMQEKNAWEGAEDITEPASDAAGVYQISSGSELAWLAQQVNSGKNAICSAVLTKDIDLGGQDNWTPIGKNSSYAFKGIFDGQGHTIKNINIEGSASGNYGLFGYMDGGTIRNLVLTGAVKVEGSGNNSYGTAGLLGTLYGTAGVVENCVNKAEINGSQNVGGIVGYVSSGYTSASKTITNCVNEGSINSNSYNAAGIAGCVSGQLTIDSCYNRGDCTSASWRAGGIAAYLNSSYAKIQNCYSTGKISGRDSLPIVGKKYMGQFRIVTIWIH